MKNIKAQTLEFKPLDLAYSKERKEITATRLKQLREEKHLSHEKLSLELSKRYGSKPARSDNDIGFGTKTAIISKQSLIDYEKIDSKKSMSIEKLCYLADFYQVSVDYLLGMTDNRTPSITIQEICNATGLSETAVGNLVKYKSLADATNLGFAVIGGINSILENDTGILDDIGLYLYGDCDKSVSISYKKDVHHTFDKSKFFDVLLLDINAKLKSLKEKIAPKANEKKGESNG